MPVIRMCQSVWLRADKSIRWLRRHAPDPLKDVLLHPIVEFIPGGGWQRVKRAFESIRLILDLVKKGSETGEMGESCGRAAPNGSTRAVT